MAQHSAIVGGSTAGRLINCPGSYRATLALPVGADTSSEFAEEGTAMHDVMAQLMRARQQAPDHATVKAVEWMIGGTFHDRVLTREHVDTMILPALERLDELEREYGSEFVVMAIEKSVHFPGIPGAWGTVDLILASPTTVLCIDWKFGQGVGVRAVTREGSAEYVNPQLMFYACGAANTLRGLFTKKTIGLAIIQPRGDEPLTHTSISRQELRWFREDLTAATILALDRDPPRKKGEHCRFAPCKVDCPLWTGPMLDLSALGVVPRTEMVSRETTPYAEYLARAKALVDVLDLFGREVNEQLHAYLEDGGTVPGWRLKAKAKQRQWVDEDVVWQTLSDLGFSDDDIWQAKLQTFASTDATAKRLGVTIPAHLRVAPKTNETTVCPTDDPAPVVDRRLAVEAFAASLKLLRET